MNNVSGIVSLTDKTSISHVRVLNLYFWLHDPNYVLVSKLSASFSCVYIHQVGVEIVFYVIGLKNRKACDVFGFQIAADL